MFWEYTLKPANVRSWAQLNVRKHSEIRIGEQCINLDIYLKLDCMEKREVTYSGSMYYMRISGKRLTYFLTLRTKITDKKQKSRTYITNITHQGFRKLLRTV